MTELDYQKILRLLEDATQVIVGQRGELHEADVRIRHLLNITTMETKRRLREIQPRAGEEALQPVRPE